MSNQIINSNDIKLKFLKDTYSVCLKHASLLVPIISIYAFVLFVINHEVEIASISDALNLSGLILVITISIMIVFVLLVVTLGILFVIEDTNGNFEKKCLGIHISLFSIFSTIVLLILSLPLLKIFVDRFENSKIFFLADVLLSFIVVNFVIIFRKKEPVRVFIMTLFMIVSFILCNIFLDTAIKDLSAWGFIMSLLLIFLLTISNIKSITEIKWMFYFSLFLFFSCVFIVFADFGSKLVNIGNIDYKQMVLKYEAKFTLPEDIVCGINNKFDENKTTCQFLNDKFIKIYNVKTNFISSKTYFLETINGEKFQISSEFYKGSKKK